MGDGSFSYPKSSPYSSFVGFLGLDVGNRSCHLAVPILAAFKIFCAHIKPMEPLAEFLS